MIGPQIVGSMSANKELPQSNNQLVIVGGGSRGLGAAIHAAYLKAGYSANLLHRRINTKKTTNTIEFHFDLDDMAGLSQLETILREVSQRGKGAHLSFHVITGGSLGVSFGQASQQAIERVLLHNATLPMLVAQHVHMIVAEQQETTADIFFYSSAVTQKFSASPFYVASKAALESFFKSYLRLIPPNLSAFLLRLGHVDISHKYFHRLSEEDPEKFQQYLADAVPSNHFTSPAEIGSFCIHLTMEKGMFNGMVCDLTGGHSWH